MLLERYASVVVQKAATFRVALIKLLSVAGISLHKCVLPTNPPRSKIRISLLRDHRETWRFVFFFFKYTRRHSNNFLRGEKNGDRRNKKDGINPVHLCIRRMYRPRATYFLISQSIDFIFSNLKILFPASR